MCSSEELIIVGYRRRAHNNCLMVVSGYKRLRVSAVSAGYGDHFPRGHGFAPTTAANGADNLELHAGTSNRRTTGAAPPSPLVSPSPHTNFLDCVVPTFTRPHHHKFPILNCVVALKDRLAVETQDPCGGRARCATFFFNLDPTLYGNCIHTSLSTSLVGAPPSRSCRASTLYKVGVRELRVDSGVASTARGEAAEGPRAKWDNRTAVATVGTFPISSIYALLTSACTCSSFVGPLRERGAQPGALPHRIRRRGCQLAQICVWCRDTHPRTCPRDTIFSRIDEAAHIPAWLVADTLKELKIEMENIGKYRPINGYRLYDHTATGVQNFIREDEAPANTSSFEENRIEDLRRAGKFRIKRQNRVRQTSFNMYDLVGGIDGEDDRISNSMIVA
ncbi:hypothetical protein B0H17DRAFT_1146967 [Mycena rosella]|uniref:Uncharacterized protein n=1 Tax=Mycena rosella TaxID=1033263 RepID=A0AAD7CMS5_MYCRO|nr:hypothetical protein B0H17DRAFT_1146967 [Mycena rosella]